MKAISLNRDCATAHHWYGLYLKWIGRTDEAVTELQLASDLDPISSTVTTNLGHALKTAGRFDRAIEQFHKALELGPTSDARRGLGEVYLEKGMLEEARAEFELTGASARLVVHRLLSDWDEALQLYDSLQMRVEQRQLSPVYLAAGALAVGDTNQALDLLSQSVRERQPRLMSYWPFSVPTWVRLSDDARFREILNSMGLDVAGNRLVQFEERRER